MNGDSNSRGNGHEGDEPTENHTAASEVLDAEPNRALLSARLEVLASRVTADLNGLAAEVEAGEYPDAEAVEEARVNLRRADAALHRHLTEADGPDLTEEEREEPTSRDVWGGDLDDAEELVDAPHGEVARRLAEDVHKLRNVAETVDRKLYAEDLTDHEARELWDAGARIESWGRDVLIRRPDREVLATPEEEELVDLEELVDGLAEREDA